MESRRLIQKRWFERREFVLGDETLLLVVRDADGLNEVHVPLENITRTRRRRLEAKGRLLAVGISCGVFAVAGCRARSCSTATPCSAPACG